MFNRFFSRVFSGLFYLSLIFWGGQLVDPTFFHLGKNFSGRSAAVTCCIVENALSPYSSTSDQQSSGYEKYMIGFIMGVPMGQKKLCQIPTILKVT